MSELDKYKKERQAFIEAKRVKENIDDVKEEEYIPLKPKTFKEKWTNYWYHYKALTFGLAFVLIFGGSLMYHILFPTKYDVSVTLIGANFYDGAYELIQSGLQDLVPDYTGNKKIEVEVFSITYDPENKIKLDPQMVTANQAKLAARLSTRDSFIYIVDNATYDMLTEQSDMKFIDLSKLTDSKRANGDRYDLTDSAFAKKVGMTASLENMSLCFIDKNVYPEKVTQKDKFIKTYNNQYETLKLILDLE